MNANKTTNGIVDTSQSKIARLAGIMFLLAFIIPTLNWAIVLSRFKVANDALATANTILANLSLFKLGITIELLMSISLVVLGWTLYILLKNVNRNLALLALLLKMVEASLMAITVLILFIALQLFNEDSFLTAATIDPLKFSIGSIFNSHTAITSIPMVFLGLDMMLFTYLLFRSRLIPRILSGFGILSFALIFSHALMYILKSEFATAPICQIIFWTPSGLFEMIIGLWLIIKGIDTE